MKTYKRRIPESKFLRTWEQNKESCVFVNKDMVEIPYTLMYEDRMNRRCDKCPKMGYYFNGFIYMYEPKMKELSPFTVESKEFYRYKVDEVKAYKVDCTYVN